MARSKPSENKEKHIPEIKIRKAKKEDCAEMMKLIRELALFEKAPEQVTVNMRHFRESGFGKRLVWYAFVAMERTPGKKKETMLGLSLYYFRYSTWKGTRLYLEDLIVTEAARGKGIGKQLFEKTLEETKKRKLSGMVWQVLDWNEPAIAFYKKYGSSFDAGWVNCSVDC